MAAGEMMLGAASNGKTIPGTGTASNGMMTAATPGTASGTAASNGRTAPGAARNGTAGFGSLPSHEGDRDPGGQPQGPTRGIIRGERASTKRKERRALEREGKPVPPWLQALKVPSLNKAENMERRKLQEQLQSLERQYNSAKSWEEQKKIGMIYWKQSTA